MAAWFALTEGRYHDVVGYAQAGQQHAGLTNAMIQLILQQARGQARLGERRGVHASLDHGAKLLEQLPRPEHPENHFVFDHTKWIFYAATCYTWLGDDEPAEEHARELIAYHARPDGSSNAPMRTAMSHVDLGIIRARHGDLDEAVHHGLTGFSYDRKTEASLLSHAADLDQLLSDRYHDEHLAAARRQRRLCRWAARPAHAGPRADPADRGWLIRRAHGAARSRLPRAPIVLVAATASRSPRGRLQPHRQPRPGAHSYGGYRACKERRRRPGHVTLPRLVSARRPGRGRRGLRRRCGWRRSAVRRCFPGGCARFPRSHQGGGRSGCWCARRPAGAATPIAGG
jgi:hypothetical protein